MCVLPTLYTGSVVGCFMFDRCVVVLETKADTNERLTVDVFGVIVLGAFVFVVLNVVDGAFVITAIVVGIELVCVVVEVVVGLFSQY